MRARGLPIKVGTDCDGARPCMSVFLQLCAGKVSLSSCHMQLLRSSGRHLSDFDFAIYHAASQRVSVQEQQEAAVPQSSLSEAEKAERRKAKKARQRAARAQVAAQTAEVGLLRRVLQCMLQTPALTENSPEMLLGAVKDAAQHHAEVAHSSGRCLRAHLEACADLNEDGR